MNKVILGLTALTSIVGFSATSGYHESKSTLEREEKTVLTIKSDLGVYLNENKNLFLFTGFDRKNEARNAVLFDGKLNYLGARLNSSLGENGKLEISAAHKFTNVNIKNGAKEEYDKESFKKHFLNHLEAKDELKKDADKDTKEKALRDHGYANEEGKTTLISTAISGKFGKTGLMLSSNYTTDKFKDGTHRVETFVRGNQNFFKGNVEVELTHLFDQKVDGEKEDSKINGGELFGHISVSSDKLAKGLEISTKNSFDLLSGITDNKTSRIYKLKTENKAKYTGIDNLELTGEAGYYYIKDNTNKEESFVTKEMLDSVIKNLPSNIPKDGLTNILDTLKKAHVFKIDFEDIHTPEVKLGAKYSNDRLSLSSMNKNMTQITISNGKVFKTGFPEEKLLRLSLIDTFDTVNKIEYKVNDAFKLNALVHYRLNAQKLKSLNNKTIDFKSEDHTLLTGLGYGFDYSNEGLTLKSEGSASYRLFGYNKIIKNNVYNGFFYTDNSLEYKLNDNVKLKTNLDVYDVIEGAIFKDENNTKKIDIFGNSFFVNPGVKLTYSKAKLTTSSDFQFNFNHNYIIGQTSSANPLIKNDMGFAVVSNSELKYDVTSKMELKTGLKLDYRYNNFDFGAYKLVKGYTKDGGFADDKFVFSDAREIKEGAKYLNYPEKTYKEIKDIKFDEVEKQRQLDIVPVVSTTFKVRDGRLVITPEVTTTFRFSSDANQKLEFNKFTGKVSLDTKYTW